MAHYAFLNKNNIEFDIDFSKLLTYRQFYHAYHDPYLIWVLSQKLKSDAVTKYQQNNVKVYCSSLFELNQHEAKELITLCLPTIIEKIRYEVTYKGVLFEVDEFEGTHSGLVLVEVELNSTEDIFEKPTLYTVNPSISSCCLFSIKFSPLVIV